MSNILTQTPSFPLLREMTSAENFLNELLEAVNKFCIPHWLQSIKENNAKHIKNYKQHLDISTAYHLRCGQLLLQDSQDEEPEPRTQKKSTKRGRRHPVEAYTNTMHLTVLEFTAWKKKLTRRRSERFS